jgi:hypothetical protein
MSESKSQDRNVTAAPVPGAEGIGNALSSGIVTTPDELLRTMGMRAWRACPWCASARRWSRWA